MGVMEGMREREGVGGGGAERVESRGEADGWSEKTEHGGGGERGHK